MDEEIDVSVFAAESQKYGDALELADRDTSCWCADAFVSRGPADDFKLCRAHRGDPRTWRPNANATALPAVSAFARRLPCFDRVGKIAIILNGRNDAGVEHCVEIKILRRVRAESSRRPPRHRRDACSMAWRCRFLAAPRSQHGRVITAK